MNDFAKVNDIYRQCKFGDAFSLNPYLEIPEVFLYINTLWLKKKKRFLKSYATSTADKLVFFMKISARTIRPELLTK